MTDHSHQRFRVKVCGVRSVADVGQVRRHGGDAIGLNFVPESIRYLDLETAKSIADAAEGLTRVGVFTTHDMDHIARTADTVGLDRVQLHGDHDLRHAKSFRGVSDPAPLMVVRLPVGPLRAADISARLDPLLQAGVDFLVDSYHPAELGGTGERLDWDALGDWIERHAPPFWILAGGLTPGNVAAAILASHAPAVDVASGVESPKGVKDESRVAAFAGAALASW